MRGRPAAGLAIWSESAAVAITAAADELAAALAMYGKSFAAERAPEAQRLEPHVARRLREANRRSTAAGRAA